jgi:hypothetical protein
MTRRPIPFATMLARRNCRPACAVAAAAVLVLAATQLTGLATGLLEVAPGLILFAILLLRRYPGERRVARLAARCRRDRWPAALGAPRPAPVTAVRAGGGLLLVGAIAGRAPPALALR